jgi:glycosyltransferase involved in cell wall biosynthesis
MPVVSVIIPTYNSLAVLPDALQSVRQQRVADVEIVVVDDDSTDGTKAWIERNAQDVRYIRQQRSGAAIARNTGVRAAKGTYVALLDADDWWLHGKLIQQLEVLARYPYTSFVACDGYVTSAGPEDTVVTDCRRLTEQYANVPDVLTLDRQFRMHSIATSGIVTKRTTYLSVGGMPQLANGEDFALCCNLLATGTARYINEPLLAYRRHPNNTSSNVASGGGWIRILNKDAARLAIGPAAIAQLTGFAKSYRRLPRPLRLLTLLYWRTIYGSSRAALLSSLLRYARYARGHDARA